MVIQYLLIGGILLVSWYAVRYHRTSGVRAVTKVGFGLFFLGVMVAVLWPDGVSAVAHLVGVGRGTDLVLYCLVVVFGFSLIATYLRIKELESKQTRLARELAVTRADMVVEHSDGMERSVEGPQRKDWP